MRNRLLKPATILLIAITHPGMAWAKNPSPPVPIGSPGDWASTSDYPAGALRSLAEGITRFVLTVSKDGNVVGCEITSGSGSYELDEATCRLVSERGRFTPGTDARGRKVQGSWASAIRWQIPKKAPEASQVVMSFLVDTEGSIINCQIEKADGFTDARLQVGPAPICPKTKFDAPYLDAKGKPISRRVRVSQTVEVQDAP